MRVDWPTLAGAGIVVSLALAGWWWVRHG